MVENGDDAPPGSDKEGRTDAEFRSGRELCAAWLYRPTGDSLASTAGPRGVPIVIMAHGFGAVRELRLPAYAERFRDAGYAVLVFDYRHFGASGGEPRQLLDVELQLNDWRAAIEFARTLDGVDSDRVVAWGTSFSGGHVITLAAEDEPLAAIIAQVPHVSGPATVRATGVRTSLRLVPVAVADLWAAIRGPNPRYIPSVGKPGTVAAMTAPGADEDVDRLAAASGLRRADFDDRVAARILAFIGRYSPIEFARHITCPALLQVAKDDRIAPSGPVRRVAEKITSATLCSYSGGHFDLYLEPLFARVVSDQLAFLAQTVGSGRHSTASD